MGVENPGEQTIPEYRLSNQRIAEFQDKLAGTIHWYYSRYGANGDIRSSFDDPQANLYDIDSDSEQKALIDQVLEKRNLRFAEQGIGNMTLALARNNIIRKGLLTGRLAIFEADLSLVMGETGIVSDDFFDDYDAPGWSTWVSYEDNALIYWVPPAHLKEVEANFKEYRSQFNSGWYKGDLV